MTLLMIKWGCTSPRRLRRCATCGTGGKMRRLGILVVLPTALMLSACGGGDSSDSSTLTESQIQRLAGEAEEAGYLDQASILEDGIVTAEEYEAAVDSYVDCVAEYGYTVSERVVSPVDSLSLEYATDTAGFNPDEAQSNIQSCSEGHISYVERGYLGSHEARMDGPLLLALDSCVSEHGVRTTGDEATARDFFELDGMDPGLLAMCISNAADELYPDLPSISVSF